MERESVRKNRIENLLVQNIGIRKKMRIPNLGLAGLLLLCSCLGGTVAGPSASPPSAQVTLNFRNVDIAVLAKFISETTGRNFLLDESVRGKVSIASATKFTPEEAYEIFDSILESRGFATEPNGNLIRIVPSPERGFFRKIQLFQRLALYKLRGNLYFFRGS